MDFILYHWTSKSSCESGWKDFVYRHQWNEHWTSYNKNAVQPCLTGNILQWLSNWVIVLGVKHFHKFSKVFQCFYSVTVWTHPHLSIKNDPRQNDNNCGWRLPPAPRGGGPTCGPLRDRSYDQRYDRSYDRSYDQSYAQSYDLRYDRRYDQCSCTGFYGSGFMGRCWRGKQATADLLRYPLIDVRYWVIQIRT
jgi:hypothetical protein